MFTYLLIDESNGSSAHIMNMSEVAEYIIATFPIGSAVFIRLYRLLPGQEPQKMYLSRRCVNGNSGHPIIRAVEIRDRHNNIQDIYSFRIPA